MKNFILVVLAASLLSGCAGGFKSWYQLRNECAAGNAQSCADFQSRNDITGAAAAGLEGYNRQQIINAVTAPQVSAPATTHCHETLPGSFTCTTN